MVAVYADALNSTRYPCLIYSDAGSTIVGAVHIRTSGKLRAQAGSTTAETTDTVPTGEWVYIWWEWKADGGAGAATMKAGFASTESKPTTGTKFVVATHSGTTANADNYNVREEFTSAQTTDYDGILVIEDNYEDLPDAYPE
jgi:hypothetical protein